MGELWLHTDRRAPMLDAASGLIAKLMLLTGLQLLATLAAAGIHRRHLMMWKIFAVSPGTPRGATASGPHRSTPQPRAFFDCMAVLALDLGLVLGGLFLVRIDAALGAAGIGKVHAN